MDLSPAAFAGETMKSPRKRLIDRLDTLFSEYIRTRDKRRFGSCPFHLGSRKPIECCFHFITRSKYSVRWDERNAVGSCHACNYKMEFDPHPFIHWYISTNGKEEYDRLYYSSHTIAKFSTADLEMILAGIKLRFENVLKD
jgi:hypothetical protein